MSQNLKESINQLIKAIEENTETYIVCGVENIVNIQYIACELEDLSNYENKEVNDLLIAIQNNIDYTIGKNLSKISFVRISDIEDELIKLENILK